MFITWNVRKTFIHLFIYLFLLPFTVSSEKYDLETPIEELSELSQEEIEADLRDTNLAETR